LAQLQLDDRRAQYGLPAGTVTIQNNQRFAAAIAIIAMNKSRQTSRKKDNRKSYLRSRARQLAVSGRFERWQSIEFELRFVEGLPEANVLLFDRRIRKKLDLLCQNARSNGHLPDET
jgi:hypothetical protein